MKRVSFKVAQAIKEAGYPQEYDDCICSWDMPYYTEDGDKFIPREANKERFCTCPTYFDVWLWLWRIKKKYIEVIFSEYEDSWTFSQNPTPLNCGLYSDPEEAIIAAIEYLCNNNLIK